MGFSYQWDILRSLLLRLLAHSKKKRRPNSRHSIGCTGRFRSLSIPTLSSLRSWREEAPEQSCRKKKRREEVNIGKVFASPDGLPSEQEEFAKFAAMHPGYLETLVVDELRDEEYGELQDDGHVCLDYSGHGLFSQLQQELDSESSSFAVSYVTEGLSLQTLSRGLEEGTIEYDIRRRVMQFLNIQEGEYGMVFTASKGSAFKLLAESYPFDAQRSLLTMFDYESEAVVSMEEIAQRYGADTLSASFSYPSLAVCSADLKALILHKKMEKGKDTGKMETVKDKAKQKKQKMRTMKEIEGERKEGKQEDKGLFVFPVQSRVTGTRYSYQWMSLAQDNGWHVLLDASALGPKDMDSLGLSLFRPDFIVTSFYKVFGTDPTGFGCLFVKNSSMSILCQYEASKSLGMVRLIPLPPQASPCSLSQEQGGREKQEMKGEMLSAKERFKKELMQAEVAFSGHVSSLYRLKQESLTFGLGKMPEDGAEDLGKIDTPATPRSVLEENRQEESAGHTHGSESLELKPHTSCELTDHGEASFNKGVLSTRESRHGPLIFLPNRICLASVDKRRGIVHHSHEIVAQSTNVLLGQGAYSQPLVIGNIKYSSLIAHSEGSSYYANSQEELEFSSSLYDEDEESSEFDMEDDEVFLARREPEIYCRGLNHADALGLNKTNDRLRFLTHWLISSLLKFQHLVSNRFVPLVRLYGPKGKLDRGPSVAFNVSDRDGALIEPTLVQELANRHKISIGVGMLAHIKASDMASSEGDGSSPPRLRVVTASLGFFTNFEDVYRLWAFVANFLDVGFVHGHKECCYNSSSQEVVLDPYQSDSIVQCTIHT